MEALAIIFLLVLIVGGLIVYNSFSWGFVLFKFWGWFIVPVFTTLPLITFWQAVGLMFVVALFHGKHLTPKEYDKTNAAVTVLLGPWLTLFVGWLIGAIWIF